MARVSKYGLHNAPVEARAFKFRSAQKKEKPSRFSLLAPDVDKTTLHLAYPLIKIKRVLRSMTDERYERIGDGSDHNIYEATLNNLREIAIRTGLGLRYEFSENPWLGNTHTPMQDGRIYLPERVKSSTILAIASKLIQGEKLFSTVQGQAGSKLCTMKEELAKLDRSKYKFGKYYIEAGNLRVAKKKNGDYGAVLGSDSLIISMISHDYKGFYSEDRVNRFLQEHKFPFELVKRTIEQLTAIEVEKAKARKSVRSISGSDRQTVGIAIDLSKKYRIDPSLDMMEKVQKAKEYLAKLELTKIGIADDLEIPYASLVIVDQPEKFHLDLCMAEHPNGGFLIHSDYEAIQLLRETLDDDNLKLSKQDRKDLQDYLKAASWSHIQFADRQEKLKQQLEEAGFYVEEFPARFLKIGDLGIFDKLYDLRDSANFLNGRSYVNSIDGTTVHLAFGSTTDALNQAIEREFRRTDRKLSFDEVNFVGSIELEDETSYGLAQGVLNDNGALRCISYVSAN